MEQHAAGTPLTEIRRMIERRYEPTYGPGTPTPAPPSTNGVREKRGSGAEGNE
jgi:hypothetical protein